MKRLLCSRLPEKGRPIELPEQEAEHAVKVLRLRDGDIVEVLDGKGHAAKATLRTSGAGGAVRVEYREDHETESEAISQELLPITLEMAILKGEAMEWVVEKAVELGVCRLIPTVTAHTVVQIKQKGPEAFQQRWQKIADQALKQCGRLQRLEVALPVSLEDLLATRAVNADQPRLWCDEAERGELPSLHDWIQNPPQPFSSASLLIGPEGGWSHEERDLLSRSSPFIHRVSLGPWVLRAETAALFGVSLLAADFRARK